MRLLFDHNLSRHLRRIPAGFYPHGGSPAAPQRAPPEGGKGEPALRYGL